MIDSHLHLDDEMLCQDVDKIIEQLASRNVQFVINNSCNYQSMLNGVELANRYPQVFATVGMHLTADKRTS